jgi:hypothetical protein
VGVRALVLEDIKRVLADGLIGDLLREGSPPTELLGDGVQTPAQFARRCSAKGPNLTNGQRGRVSLYRTRNYSDFKGPAG